MRCSHRFTLESLAHALVQGVTLELYLTPKPGLVDLADCGSHPDLSVPVMERSIRIIENYLEELTESLDRGEPFYQQNLIGRRAEQQMFAQLGTNTHKGYIFLSGMLLIARQRARSAEARDLRSALSSLCDDFFSVGESQATHGQRAREQYNTGGIVMEALGGLPSVFEEALPAFRNAMKQHDCFITASFAMLARLMQVVDDTTTLHRAGSSGLARVKRDGRTLELQIASGEDYMRYLADLNRSYVGLNITMGGIADLQAPTAA